MQHPGYEPPPPEAASPMVSRSDSVNSRRAHSFRTSTSPTVTAASDGSNALLSFQTTFKMAWRIARTRRNFYVTPLDHISPSLYTRLVTHPSRTRTGRGPCSRCAISDFLQSSVKRWVARRREGWMGDGDAGYGCMRRISIVACDSTHISAFGARYVEIFFPWCLSPDISVCRMAATPSACLNR